MIPWKLPTPSDDHWEGKSKLLIQGYTEKRMLWPPVASIVIYNDNFTKIDYILNRLYSN